jgi:hypothetical protein
MAYDVVRESVTLIEAGCAEPVRSLTRRRRFAAMAVDVSDDVAVTMFARRGVGCVHQEVHHLALREDGWAWLGGGGGTSDERLLADRPASLSEMSLFGPDAPKSSDPRIIASVGAGGTLDTRGQDEPPDGGRWISRSIIRVNAEVESVEVFNRTLIVPWHGYVVVVWCGPPPDAVARDATGKWLAELRYA